MASSGITSKRTRFTGAEFIVHFLERQGIQVVTGIPGGSILPVYDALSQSTQIRHILRATSKEQGLSRREWREPMANPPSVWPAADRAQPIW